MSKINTKIAIDRGIVPDLVGQKWENILCPNLVGIDLSYFAMFESVLQNSMIMSYNILRYYFVLIGKANNLGQVITASYLFRTS